MATQLNEFGKKVFVQLLEEEKNVVISPMSIFTALGMLLFGANGTTKEELLKALHFSSDTDVEPLLEKLMKSFASEKEASTVSIANNIFVKKDCTLQESYASIVKRLYSSEVTTKDFFFEKKDESAKEINDWVAEQTHNNIKDLLNSRIFTKDTMLILVSAIYFKAAWQNSFDSELTKEQAFHVSAKETKQVQMMNKTGQKIQYGESDEAKWVRLPYKPSGKEFNAIFVLPRADEKKKLSDVIPYLFTVDRTAFLTTQNQKLERLAIPKFKIEYGAELKPLLEKIGIRAAFSNGADLKGIAENEDLEVSNVIHKAMVEVDEEGAVAAAATAIALSRKRRVTKEKTYEFIANQPFFFMLEHVPSKSIVFTAKVHDPTSQ